MHKHRLVLRPFAVVKEGIVWATGQVEPNNTLLQLATSPSTSDVQDRVVQAAAKHGPLPSEPSDQVAEDSPQSLQYSQNDGPSDTVEVGSDGAQAT